MSSNKDIRKKAWHILNNGIPQDLPILTDEIAELVEELRIYHIELEIQNQELRQTQANLKASQNRFFQLYNLAPVGYITMNEQGQIKNLNLAAAQLLGQDHTQLQGQPIIGRIHADSHTHFYTHLDRTFQTKTPQLCELIINRNDTDVTPYVLFESVIVEEPTRAGEMELLSYTVIIDISQRKMLEQQLFQLAHYDSLTQLPNRNLFQQMLEKTVIKADQTGVPFALMLCDLNEFKILNDSLGHQVGDQLLTKVAKLFSNTLSNADFIARLGGDEFAIIISNVKYINTAKLIASRILGSLKEAIQLDPNSINISACIGISIYPTMAEDVHTLFKQADLAMYKAKEVKGNSYEFYYPELQLNIDEYIRMESLLRKALQKKQFSLAYQIQIDVEAQRIIGVEALLRWTNQENERVSPSKFIHFAEKNGLIVPIGAWVIKTATKQAAKWNQELDTPIKVAVNISAQEFYKTDIVDKIMLALEISELDPHLLEIEVTETVLLKKNEEILSKMERLKEIGVNVVLDDFGMGYSSLNYLHQFPIDKLKIDRSFIAAANDNDKQKSLVIAIIRMAEALDLELIAEGVETKGQYQFLKENRCVCMQGFLFSKALPAPEILPLFKNPVELFRFLEA